MPIRELYHFMQIVDDFDAAQGFYDALLQPETYMAKSWSDFDKRWASLGVVGPDFVLEIMEPSKLSDDQGKPLPKFRARHGQHWHSFSWYIDDEDMPALVGRLKDFGVRVITPYPGQEESPSTIFTHPKDTFGQLEIQAIGATSGDPRFGEGWSAARWREGPLQLERTSHMTTVVSDLERARNLYETCLEAKIFHVDATAEVESVYALVGTETVVELAHPITADSAVAKDLAEHGDLPHSMTFKVADVDAVARYAESLGLSVTRDGDATVVVGPGQAFGAVLGFTENVIPGDPRL